MLGYENHFQSFERKTIETLIASSTSNELVEAHAFAELKYFVDAGIEIGVYIYKLSELHSLCKERLGVFQSAKSINRSRLKTELPTHFFPECQEQNDGKHVSLVFDEGILLLFGLLCRRWRRVAESYTLRVQCYAPL